MDEQKYTTIRIDYDLYLELVKLREKVGIPVTESVRRAIREYLEKQEQQSDEKARL